MIRIRRAAGCEFATQNSGLGRRPEYIVFYGLAAAAINNDGLSMMARKLYRRSQQSQFFVL